MNETLVRMLVNERILLPSGKLNTNVRKMMSTRQYLLSRIYQATGFLDGTKHGDIRTRIRCIVDGINTLPLCRMCDAPARHDGEVFTQYCSVKCSNTDPSRIAAVKETNRVRYGGNAPMCSKVVVEKSKSTNIKRYGAEFHQLTDDGKQQRRATNVANHGTSTPFESATVQQKCNETMYAKYGNTSFTQSTIAPQSLELLTDKQWLEDQHTTNNLPIYHIADSLGVSTFCVRTYMQNHKLMIHRTASSYVQRQVAEFVQSITPTITTNDRTTIPPYELDIVVHSHNVAIEVNGIYWHGERNGKSSGYHRMKTDMCQAVGIRLIHITDKQWLEKREAVETTIRAALEPSSAPVTISPVSPTVAATFVSTYSLSPDHSFSVAYAAHNTDGSVVAVMAFAPIGPDHWDIRYATRVGTGPAADMLEAFISKFAPTTLTTRTNTATDDGQWCKDLAFVATENLPPAPLYFRTNRPMVLLEEIPNDDVSAYDTIWDCGSVVWVLPVAGSLR